jgi:hypothetical protein
MMATPRPTPEVTMHEELADATLQEWLSELPYYEPWHLDWGFAEIEIPVKGRPGPVKAPAFIGYLRTEHAAIRIECVAAEDLPPRGYMRGSMAASHVVAERSGESSVVWEELGTGHFDRPTLMEILAMASSYELVGNDEA